MGDESFVRRHGRAVRTRSSRYTCIESALMIVPLTRSAMAIASADLPLAVGPATMRAVS